MPKNDKIRSINVSKKWKTWYIKSENKTSIVLSYCEIFPYYQLIHLSIILFYLVKSKVEPTGTLIDHFLSGPPKYHSLLASHNSEPHPTHERSLLSLEKQKSLNINITSYFIKTLASLHVNTWYHRGGPITHKIDNISLNHDHRRYLKNTWNTFILVYLTPCSIQLINVFHVFFKYRR